MAGNKGVIHSIGSPKSGIQADDGLANINRNKSKRRRPWISYERDHSLSLVHLDWHTSNHNGKKVYVCVVLDDSSRCILAGGEFDAETTENALQLLKEAMDKFGWLASIEQVLTDRGTSNIWHLANRFI